MPPKGSTMDEVGPFKLSTWNGGKIWVEER